ncbi:hypothetical protein SAMN05444161_3895 [Rhizobiales bacterium GAS191]|nr:hypothetical protein SAMN05444161_3895 [Rhizobiales bacterium GAS191]
MATIDILRSACSKLDELDHKLKAVEIREAREHSEAEARAKEAAHLRSREHLMEVQAAARNYQVRADDALQPWGLRARAPVLGEPLGEYRRDILDQVRRQLPDDHQLRAVRPRRLDADALDALEPQILSAVRVAATQPDTVPQGQLRAVHDIDQNGLKITKWIGQQSFIHELARPGRFARIRTPDNFRDRPFFRSWH